MRVATTTCFVIAVLSGIVGLLTALGVWMASGMSTIPGIRDGDLQTGLLLPGVAVVFGTAASLLSATSVPREQRKLRISIAVVLLSAIAIIFLLVLYSMNPYRHYH